MSRPLFTTPPSLNFTHPCHFCGATTHVVNGYRMRHVCRIDLDASRGTPEHELADDYQRNEHR